MTAALPPMDGVLDLRLAPGVRWVEIDEIGQSIEFVDETAKHALSVPIPLRHGWHVVQPASSSRIALRRVESSAARGRIQVHARCDDAWGSSETMGWFTDAAQFAGGIDVAASQEQVPILLRKAQALIDAAPDKKTLAFALHLRAQALVVNGNHADSAEAFAQARTAWIAANDPSREYVAVAAMAEDEYRTGHFKNAIALFRTAPTSSVDAYFRTRLENTACLSLQALGRMSEALSCFERTTSTYAHLREIPEYSLASQAYANALKQDGRVAAAERVAERALVQVYGVDAALNRGRLRVLLSDIALDRGDAAEALRRLWLAVGDFDVAKVRRWQANSWLGIARIYLALGAATESRAALLRATQLLTSRDAPARVAMATHIASAIEQQASHAWLADVLAQMAERQYAALQMKGAAEDERLSRVQFALDAHDLVRAEQFLAAPASSESAASKRRTLLEARLALEHGDSERSLRLLASLRSTELPLELAIQLALLDADNHRRNGDASASLAAINSMVARIAHAIGATRNPVLRNLLRRQLAPLRRAGYDRLLASDSTTPSQILSFLLRTSAGVDASPVDGLRVEASTFDGAVARELLSNTPEDRRDAHAAAQLGLLATLATTEVRTKRAEALSRSVAHLPDLQRALGEDDAFIAILEGDKNAGLLWVRKSGAGIRPIGPSADLHRDVERLARVSRLLSEPLAAIDAASKALSTRLLDDGAFSSVPARLYVLDDGAARRIPHALLRWPSSGQMLLDTTAVATVRLAEPASVNMHSSPSVTVLLAPQAAAKRLSPLDFASSETAAIAAAVAQANRTVSEVSATTSTELLDALAKPGEWVHVAAHGRSDPRMLGYSGIWLEPSQADAGPGFASWLDVLGHRGGADLTVLAACDLGDPGSYDDESPSFASAAVMAGTRQVVASAWPLSDAASGVWIPAFYSAMAESGTHDAAEAVRSAQRTLRQQRMFRHPFYWAGMTTIVRWDVLQNDRPPTPPK